MDNDLSLGTDDRKVLSIWMGWNDSLEDGSSLSANEGAIHGKVFGYDARTILRKILDPIIKNGSHKALQTSCTPGNSV